MTSAQVVDLKGNKVGEVQLNDDVFAIEPNQGAMHTSLVRQLANARSGSANSKTRSEVSGGGRKPWRQKGTGRARAGSIRSPLWSGGGVVFGPKPRSYEKSMPRKMRILAIKSALAARRDNLVVVKDFDVKNGKTKEMFDNLKGLKLEGKNILLVLDFACDNCARYERAARNIEGVKVLNVSNLNVKDLLQAEVVLTTERSLEAINNRFRSTHGEGASAPRRKAKGHEEGEGKGAARKATAKKAEGAKKETKAAPKKAAAKSDETASKKSKKEE